LIWALFGLFIYVFFFLITGIRNPLEDDRFASMFTNKDFQVDFESEEYKLLHPVISKQDKVRRQASTTQEGEASDSGSDDDHELWEKVKIDRRAERLAKREKEERDKVKMYTMKEGVSEQINGGRASQGETMVMGEMLKMDTNRNIVNESGTALGSREITFTLENKKRDRTREEALKAHKKERKKVRRPIGQLLAVEKKKPVYWRGKKVK